MKYIEEANAYLRRHGLRSMRPKAWLVDMDGTLYDSMPNHANAWHSMIGELGIDVPVEEFFLYEGATGAATVNKIFQREYGREASAEEVEKLYHRKTEIFRTLPLPAVMPGGTKTDRNDPQRHIASADDIGNRLRTGIASGPPRHGLSRWVSARTPGDSAQRTTRETSSGTVPEGDGTRRSASDRVHSA